MIPRFLYRLAGQWCLDCQRLMWPGQARCFGRHSSCKHSGDAHLAERNAIPRWACGACGR